MNDADGMAKRHAPGVRLDREDGDTVTRFSVAAPDASALWLCLFDDHNCESRHAMQRDASGQWTLARTDCPAGTRYGFRADGRFAPQAGHWFNPSKLLLDPYARRIEGHLSWHQAVFESQAEATIPVPCSIDSAPFVPRSIVVDEHFDWQHDQAPRIPWSDTVLYELHVKGFTQLHPEVPDNLRGKYLGLIQPAVLEYLQSLGITSVQLLPTAAFLSEHHLTQKGLVNYWGYNPIAMFAPHPAYAVDDPVQEFKRMVHGLHKANIEVIIDIVLNHTAEADHSGPVLCMRGLDNSAWYRLVPGKPFYYENFSGCGNSVNTAHPRTLEFTLACMRYWIDQMHVDGFRFDLAASLGRDSTNQFNPQGEFFRRVAADPVLSQAKLIAEPWDVGHHGYQLGHFPEPWRECNGDYRDEVRGFWNHRSVNVGAFAERIAGSSDLYKSSGRAPTASVNFVTCHDGFSLRDLVSYDNKHNQANGEDNQDGNNFNLSANHGAEGPTEDPEILALRDRQQRNFLATLALSQGVPHLLAGDEFGHSQQGNNNAYCQDNETSWLNWDRDPAQSALVEFVRSVLQIRKNCRGFRRRHFLTGEQAGGQAAVSAIKDVTWLHPSGREMNVSDWHDPHLHCLGMLLTEHEQPEAGRERRFAHLVLFNSGLEAVEFAVPECPADSAWTRLFDTAAKRPELPFRSQSYRLGARACAAFSEPLN